MRPDPYDDTVNSDYMTGGAYFYADGPTGGVRTGYVTSLFKGAEDSSYIYGTGYMALSSMMRVYGNIRVDNNIDKGGFELTNMVAALSFRPSRGARIHISYNEYRAIKLYESMDYDINHELQRTIRVQGRFNITRSFSFHAGLDMRTRESDNMSASLVSGGVRKEEIFNWGFADLSFYSIDYFGNTIMRLDTSIGAQSPERFDVEASVSYMLSESDQGNDLAQLVYAGRVDWYVNRDMYVSGRVEMSDEQYLDVESVYVEKQSDHFSAITYFFYIGYKF